MFNSQSSNKSELQKNLSFYLKSFNVSNSEVESQIIIAHAANKDLFLDVDYKNINFDILKKIIIERVNGKPLSKILNQKGFWNQIFYTNQYTLDPRQESEIIVENILKDLNGLKKQNLSFIDLCCGTGCLGISLLEELNSSECYFIDISVEALEVCKKNISKMNVHNRSQIFKSNLFEDIPEAIIINSDFIVSNPPYIPTNHIKNLDKSTLYDPILALDGGSDGLFFYKEIINYLYEIEYKGEVYFEIDPLIISDFLKFLLEKNVKISYKKDDYLKLDRLLKISLPFNY
jgi:release factor glutamine methyltransferase